MSATMAQDYQDYKATLAVAIVLPVLSAAAVGLRFYARRRQRINIGIDDWCTIPALVSMVQIVKRTVLTGFRRVDIDSCAWCGYHCR